MGDRYSESKHPLARYTFSPCDLAADNYVENIKEKELRKWIEKVRLLDEKRLHYLARQKEAVDNALHVERARSGIDK